jgi:hypothetical protein
MVPPLPPPEGTPMDDAAEYRFWKELARLRAVAGISTSYIPAFRRAAVAMRKASAITAGRCSPNPGRWPPTAASRKFVHRLVERLQPY